MNLAPMKYATILKDCGGPIEIMASGTVDIGARRFHQVNVRLADVYNLEREEPQYFSSADGTGVDRHLLIAQYKSISEALERWAFYYLSQIGYVRTYGFDVEPSTTGMAAYPGLFAWQARKRAKREAEERWCVHYWWRGELRGTVSEHGDHKVLEIENPLSRARVILTWREFAPGRHAYGTAAGRTWEAAHAAAWQEMELSALAMGREPDIDSSTVRALPNAGERQILYYSLPEGHARFRERLNRDIPAWSGVPPKPLIDCQIPGPWQEYTTVWRVLYPMKRETGGDPLTSDFLY